MTITIKIKTDNDAFTEDKHAEVSRIVRVASRLIGGGYTRSATLYDYNGNAVGSVTVTGR